jgi:outer membrane protein, multidrug efflux system
MPCSWRVASDLMSTAANIRWWEAFGDPILNELILEALANNKDLKVAIARVCEYFARYQVARAPLLPEINLEGIALKEKIPERTNFIPSGFSDITPFYAYAFTLAYELDFWGKIQSQVHAAREEALEQVENRRTVVLTLVSSVAQAYVLLRQLDREREIALATVEERKEYLRLAKIRFEGGLTSEIEVAQAATLLDNARAELTSIEEQIPQQENLISLLIGRASTCILRGKEIAEFSLPIEIPAGLPSELLCRRPDILAAEKRLIATNADIGAARAAFFPQFNLTGLYGAESFQLGSLFSPEARAWHIGISFLQPIFTGGRLKGQLKVAWAVMYQALFTYEQTVLNAIREVNDALIAFKQSQELVDIQIDNVAANKRYVFLSWLRYYNGQTDYLTVLNAEQELFSAQLALAQAQGDVFLALTELYKALGGGWVIDADCCLRS